MGEQSHRWKERLRRYGPLGFVGKTALKVGEGALKMGVEAQYTAPLDSVSAALAGVNIDDDVRVRVLKGRKSRSDLFNRIQGLNTVFSAPDLAAYDRVAIAEVGKELLGYWCFVIRDGSLYERGVCVAENARGRRIASRLLMATIDSLETRLEQGRLIATSDMFNRSSRRMLERCGLQLDGVLVRGRLPLMGEVHLVWKPPG